MGTPMFIRLRSMKGEYKTKFLSGVVQNYFENSYKEDGNFFARKQKISAKELEEIIRLIEKRIGAMEDFQIYILQVNAGLVVFYLLYRMLFSRDTF